MSDLSLSALPLPSPQIPSASSTRVEFLAGETLRRIGAALRVAHLPPRIVLIELKRKQVFIDSNL